MNKKFLVGLSSVAVIGSLVGCGEGEINTMTPYDDAIKGAYVAGDGEDQDETLMLNAIKDCQSDPLCAQKMGSQVAASSNSTVNPTSSTSIPNQGGISSSDDSGPVVIVTSSASTGGDIIVLSSSSAEVIPSSKLGSCAPETAVIEKGGSTTWKFTPKDIGSIGTYTSASYTWNFENGTPGTETKTGMKSSAVTYLASGKAGATVTVLNETITCSSLQVNGDPITGCECTTAASSVDFTATPDVAWTVTGCKSASEPLSYTWDGAAGEATFTKTFAAAQAGYAPTLVVGNSDNTAVTVTCPAVKTTAGPEYLLTFEGTNVPSAADVSTEIPFNVEACINVSFNWTNSGYSPTNISVLCDVTAAQNQPGLTMDVTYNATTKSYKGDYNISNSGVALGAITSGQNNKGDVCVTINGTAGGTAKCFFGN